MWRCSIIDSGTLGGVASTIENGEVTTRKREGAVLLKAVCSRPGNGKV